MGGIERHKPGGNESNRDGSGKPAFAPGDPVRITAGAAVGVEGVIYGRWPRYWERGIPLWVVLRRDLVERSIVREDYLEPIAKVA